MENIVQNNTNYLMAFYKNKDENKYSGFFKIEGEDENKINEAKMNVKKATIALESAKANLELEYSNKYSKRYTPIERPNILTYSSRNGDTYYYDMSGTNIKLDSEEEKNYTFISLETKHGIVTVLDGYCYELASFVLKSYGYSISSNNEHISLKLSDEILIPFFTDCYYRRNGAYKVERLPWNLKSVLEKYNSSEFLNKFYGINREFTLNLASMMAWQANNPAFEIIIKTAPDSLVNNLLAMKNIEKPMPVYKLLNVTQEIYNIIIKKGIEVQYCALLSYINKKEIFHKTEMDWVELIEDMEHKQEDLDFFHINYNLYTYGYRDLDNCPLIGLLAYKYSSNPNLYENYSFGKFCDYVVEETINQGFTEVRTFVNELEDYLKMCKDQNIVPTLYSSYLTQTHDIAARNHKVFLDIHQEEIFKQRYEDYKPVKVGEYQVIAPTKSDDVKHEGDALNHCVASYIKRIIDGTTRIFFLRKDPLASLITLEIREGKICQARGMHNRKPTPNEDKAIADFAKKKGFELAY